MAQMQFFTVNPPTKWQAGSTGAERTPFFFSCADCGKPDAEIAGIIGTGPTFAEIGILPSSDGHSPFVKPAMFCAPCFAKRIGRA